MFEFHDLFVCGFGSSKMGKINDGWNEHAAEIILKVAAQKENTVIFEWNEHAAEIISKVAAQKEDEN